MINFVGVQQFIILPTVRYLISYICTCFVATCSISGQPSQLNLLPYVEGVSDWKRFGLYLLPETHTFLINDIDKNHKHDVAECRWALITEYLKVGEVSWDKVIYALQKSGNPNIAVKIRRDIFNNDDPSTKSSTDHERHEQSPNTIGKLYMCLLIVIFITYH